MSKLFKPVTRLAFVALLLLSLSAVGFAATSSPQKHRRHRVARAKHARRISRRVERVATFNNAPPPPGPVVGSTNVDPGTSGPIGVSEQPSTSQTPRAPISGGILNGKAISLPKPAYPPIARAARASGTVVVQVTVDEDGNVISAHAVSGHPLLQASAVQAARQAKFSPTRLNGQPVKVTGVIQYNFVAQ